jgi:5-methyltetrahydropteroyltriglutamate--homocysteine methyltransferase
MRVTPATPSLGGDIDMQRSTDRILTTHVGSLPRPEDLRELLVARDDGQAVDEAAFETKVRRAVDDVLQEQVKHGLDVVNDGEQSKRSWSTYARERVGGHEPAPRPEGYVAHTIYGRDNVEFAEYFEMFGPGRGPNTRGGISASGAVQRFDACVGPLTYVGQAFLQRDIDNLKAGLQSATAAEAFMSAVSPGTIEHWLHNQYYKSEEEYLFAIADAMRVEYEAIVDAGFVLQIDDPDLADAWQMHPEMDVGVYRRHAGLRI